jgi:hypothetical protein
MFAIEDRPFVRFSPFFALFPDAHIRLNSVRPRPAASSLPPGADFTRSPHIQYTSATPCRLHRDKKTLPSHGTHNKHPHTRREQAF